MNLRATLFTELFFTIEAMS